MGRRSVMRIGGYPLEEGKYPFMSHFELVVGFAAGLIILVIIWPWFTKTMKQMMDQGIIPQSIQGK